MTRAALALTLFAACHRHEAAQAGMFPVPLTADAPDSDPIVATVDGRPIRAGEVAVQAQARGTDARVALHDLIDAEVLAGEAARRRLDQDRDAIDAARAAAVRRLLAVEFERQTTADKIPERDLRRAYQMNINMLDHSEYVDVWHLLVPVAKTATTAERDAARAVAEELARRARGIASAADFQALAQAVPPPDEHHPFKVERIVTARDGWVLKTFSYAAFELKKPGDTSAVVETDYGYHVIYLNQRLPPVHITVDEAAPKLRAMVFPDFQKREFAHFIDEQTGKHQVDVHYDRIK